MKPNNNNKNTKMDYSYIFKVNKSDELLTFLLSKINTSRNNVKSLLTNKQVLVNGVVITQFNFVLAKEDEVKIAKKPVVSAIESKSNKRTSKKFYSIDILYEDDDFIAINKPTGLLSVKTDNESTDTAYNYVLEYLQSRNKMVRPFVLHRIDKDTSGILLFTKNVKLHSILRLNWNDYVKVREYAAVVEGHLDPKEGQITSYLKENQFNLVYSTKDPSGELAITNYKVTKENVAYSLVKVNLETGRKNQIRVHMLDMGCPIVGDDKYGDAKDPLKRLGLHHTALELQHPFTKEIIRFNAPIPHIFLGLFK